MSQLSAAHAGLLGPPTGEQSEKGCLSFVKELSRSHQLHVGAKMRVLFRTHAKHVAERQN